MRVAPPEIYPDARAAHRAGALSDGELGCAFVVDRVRARFGERWQQGAWSPSLSDQTSSPVVALVAERRLCRVPRAVSQALVAWALQARPVELRFDVPAPREVLALQARGRRCVSLLEDGTLPPGVLHEDALAFCVHDLCHLEKLVAAEDYASQVGFFSRFHEATSASTFHEFEAGFDALWAKDRDYVTCDMNGSAIFLFAALKMKVKMAVRRRMGHARMGPLDAREEEMSREVLRDFFGRLGMLGPVVDDGFAVSTRRDALDAAARLHAWFEERGRRILGEERLG